MGDWADLEEHWAEMRKIDEVCGYARARDEYLNALEEISLSEDEEDENEE